MTRIHRVIFAAAAWMPRSGYATMPIVVSVAGDTTALVPDLCQELANHLAWGIYADNVIPADSLPRGTVKTSARIVGGLIVTLDANQSAPEYEDGSAKPSYSEVRLTLNQPITNDLDDLALFISRRAEVCAVLALMNGVLESPPAFGAGIDWDSADWLAADWA